LAGSYTFGKQERLKSRRRIEQLFSEGKKFAHTPLLAYFLIRSLPAESAGRPEVQVGVGVSNRHFRKAVDRNTVKRRMREAYRLQKTGLQQKLLDKGAAMDVFFIYTGRELPDFAIVREKMATLLRRLEEELDQKL